jgi:hypothetical protein
MREELSEREVGTQLETPLKGMSFSYSFRTSKQERVVPQKTDEKSHL